MNKTQTEELYDRVQINWGLKPLTKKMRDDSLRVWHRYLQGCPYEAAAKAVDARALAGGFPPRPAEIFTAVAVADNTAPPSPAKALVDSKELTLAVQHGTKIPDVHPLVSQTLADVGVQRDDIFTKLYEERRLEALTKLFDLS